MPNTIWDPKVEPCRDEKEKRASRKVAGFYF